MEGSRLQKAAAGILAEGLMTLKFLFYAGMSTVVTAVLGKAVMVANVCRTAVHTFRAIAHTLQIWTDLHLTVFSYYLQGCKYSKYV